MCASLWRPSAFVLGCSSLLLAGFGEVAEGVVAADEVVSQAEVVEEDAGAEPGGDDVGAVVVVGGFNLCAGFPTEGGEEVIRFDLGGFGLAPGLGALERQRVSSSHCCGAASAC